MVLIHRHIAGRLQGIVVTISLLTSLALSPFSEGAGYAQDPPGRNGGLHSVASLSDLSSGAALLQGKISGKQETIVLSAVTDPQPLEGKPCVRKRVDQHPVPVPLSSHFLFTQTVTSDL